MKLRITKILIIFFLGCTKLFANTDFFNDGLKLYKNEKFDEAKFKFEQDLIFNPKSELAYLYLSKIFKNQKKKILKNKT